MKQIVTGLTKALSRRIEDFGYLYILVEYFQLVYVVLHEITVEWSKTLIDV